MENLTDQELDKLTKVGMLFDFLYGTLGGAFMFMFVAGLFAGNVPVISLGISVFFAYKLGGVQKQNRAIQAEIQRRTENS